MQTEDDAGDNLICTYYTTYIRIYLIYCVIIETNIKGRSNQAEGANQGKAQPVK